jgi:16S rRNA C1402 N4-methylase RsmH
MGHLSLVQQAHTIVAEVLKPGDIAVDATVGNGHDTEFLAQRVGRSGDVYGFDVQPKAIQSAQVRLAQSGVEDAVTFINAGHETLISKIPQEAHGKVSAVMFNLGYLLGSEKLIVTRRDTTLMALDAALKLLTSGGVITVVAYTGHPGGREEAEAVKEWMDFLPESAYRKTLIDPPGSKQGRPCLYAILGR